MHKIFITLKLSIYYLLNKGQSLKFLCCEFFTTSMFTLQTGSTLIQMCMSARQQTSAQNRRHDLATHLKYVENCPSVRPKASRALLAVVSLLTVQN